MRVVLLAAALAACDARSGNAVASDDAVMSGNAIASAGGTTGNTAIPPEQPAPPPNQSVPAWDASRCGDDDYQNARMERHPALIGRSDDDLIAAYGKPHAEDRFRAGEGVGTYSGGVASQLPSGAPRNARTPVREIIWRAPGATSLSVSTRIVAPGACSTRSRRRPTRTSELPVPATWQPGVALATRCVLAGDAHQARQLIV